VLHVKEVIAVLPTLRIVPFSKHPILHKIYVRLQTFAVMNVINTVTYIINI
jgi:hypothetical protein